MRIHSCVYDPCGIRAVVDARTKRGMVLVVQSRLKRLGRALVAVTLLGSSLVAFTVVDSAVAPTPAEAVVATQGQARFKAIDWVSWGTTPGQAIPNTGKTVTETSTIAGQTLAVTCTVNNIKRTDSSTNSTHLEAYRPGTWQGDGFDELYNIGGTGSNNQMVVGLSNRGDGATVTFDFTCSATLGGEDLPLSGLVMADAEASGSTEHVAATIPTTDAATGLPTTWRILDRVRGANCTLAATARRTVSGSNNTLAMYGPANNSCENNPSQFPGPSAIAFMENATSATNVTVKGGGKSAIALGVLLDFDFGDAPASYGEAVAATQFAYTGGEVPLASGTFPSNRGTNLFSGFDLATVTQPTPRLGAVADGELFQPYSNDATGDDIAPAAGPDDEDAVSLPASTTVTPGGTYTTTVACTRNPGTVAGKLAGWIDWNLNGVFDASERSTATPNCPASGSVTLTWDVPVDVLPTQRQATSFMRLRIAGASETLSPTGRNNAGEVEDHAFTFTTRPRLTVRKLVDGGRLAANDQFRVVAEGPGLGAGQLVATTNGSQTTASAGPALVQSNQTYTISESMVPGSTNPLSDYAARLECVDTANNNAPVTVQGSAPSWTLSGLGTGQRVRCDVTNTPRATTLDVAKRVDGAVTGPDAQGRFQVNYDVTVTNSGPRAGSYGPLTDSLTFPANAVVDSVTWTSDAPGVPGGSGTGTGPHTLAPANTAIVRDTSAGSPTVHRYRVAVTFHYTNTTAPVGCAAGGGLGNRASLPNGQETGPTGNNSACAPPPTPPVGALSLDKQAGDIADANGTGRVDAGDTIAYTFVVTNPGPVTISGVSVVDPKVGAVTCPQTTLGVGVSTTCTATYTLTQADIDAGSVDNIARATGTTPSGRPVESPPDTTSTPVVGPASLALDKQASLVDANSNGVGDVGERISYSFTVTNTGSRTLATVVVSDPMFPGLTCPTGSLQPGASLTCGPVTHQITQADVDAGSVQNTATATGTTTSGTPVPPDQDDTSTPLVGTPALLLDKRIVGVADTNSSTITDAGDTITYGFTVTNTGNVTLTGVGVDDPELGNLTCAPTTLAPGASADCGTADYTITAADQAAGSADNTATATGTPPRGTPVTDDDSTSVPVTTPAPGLRIDKTAGTPSDTNGSGLVDAGDTIVYTFTVTNSGNVPLSGVRVSDPMLEGADADALADCVIGALAVGASVECTATPYVITAADQGSNLVNTATATGTPPGGGETESEPDTTTTPVATPDPSITVVKAAATPVDVDDSGLVDEGDTIVYSFAVTNTGNVPLTEVTVDDPMLDGLAITCPTTTLAPGASTTCTAEPYTITAQDVTDGAVDNVATALGTPPGVGDPDEPGSTPGTPVESEESSTSTPTDRPGPSLALDKSVSSVDDTNGSGLVDAGDEVRYSFRVTNTGNVPLTSISVTDDLLSAQDPPVAVTCPAGRLAVGASVTCVASGPYVITAADEGTTVVNTATASGTPPRGPAVPSEPDQARVRVVVPQPGLTLVKSAGTPQDVNNSGITDAGDTIGYTFTVTNTGDVPLRNITVSDPMLNGVDPAISVTCPTGPLAPGRSATCVASAPYTVTAADETAGQVHNVATASGRDPDNEPVPSEPSDTTTLVVRPDPGLRIDKTAGTPTDVNGSGITDAGDTIQYSFTVTNTGNVPLSGIAVQDAKLSGQASPAITLTCAATTLAVGASTTCTASAPYVVTAQDVASGSVDNRAVAVGRTPDDEPLTSSPDSTSTPTVRPTPGLTLLKTAGTPVDVNRSGITDAGDTIEYTFTVTNTGNVPISEVAVDDPKLSGLAITCQDTALAPGASTTCAAEPYTITEADQRSGAVANTATARGEDPDGGTVDSPPSSTSTPTTTPRPSLQVDKAAGTPVDVNRSGITDAGDTIEYTFTVTNTGNVPVEDVVVNDPMLADAQITVTCAPTTLAPGASLTCTASKPYVVTEADEKAGQVRNTATATGTPPGPGTTPGTPVTSPPDTTTTPVVTPQPLLAVEKTAGTPVDVNDSGITDAGDTIQYSFTVTNTGNVPVHDVVVNDPMLADAGLTVTCDPTTLAPGESSACTTSAPYVITAADVSGGTVQNRAVAEGEDPDGDPVTSPPDSTTTPTTEPFAGLSVEKTAATPVDVNGSGITDAGDTIEYTFVVTNTGNVPVRALEIVDPMLGGTVVCDAARVPVGGSVECATSSPYTITAADVEAGAVHNTALARGVDPDGGEVESPPDSTTTPVTTPVPSLDIEKIAGEPVDRNGSGITDAGDTIEYSFTVTNTGNVPLTDVLVSDARLAAQGITVTCDPTRLAPGGTATCTTSEPYTVTAADVTAGAVVNSATATGTPPGVGTTPGEPVTSPPDTTTTPVVTPEPQLDIEKSAGEPVDRNGSGITDAGDTIEYSFTVTNTGNVPLTDVLVSDARLAAQGITVTCDPTRLAPGGTATCTTSEPYTVTAADVTAGAVVNSATATGTPPGDGDPNDPGTTPGTPVTSPPDTTTTPVVTPEPQLSIEKSAGEPVDRNGSGLVDAGDTVVYSFTVTNTGNVPLTDVAVDDPGLPGLTVTCTVDALAPGASTTCTSQPYVITPADVTTGAVVNTATATGTPPGDGDPNDPGTTPGTPVTSPPDSTSVPTTTPEPALQLDKRVLETVDLNESGITDVGDLVRYEFTVTNTGNVPVSTVTVVDPRLSGAATPVTVVCRATALDPGESTVCDTGSGVVHDGTAGWYRVTAADEASGAVVNTAHATGQDPDDEPVRSPDDTTSVPVIAPQAQIVAWKSASAWHPGPGNPSVPPERNALAGDLVTFSFRVQNTGNVPLTVIRIDDPMLNGGAPMVCVEELRLAPGEAADCASVDHTITQAEIDRGSIHNSAIATAQPPGPGEEPGEPIESPPTDTTTPLTRVSGISIAKRVLNVNDTNSSGITDPGDRVRYGFRVTNTGNTTLTGVEVRDPKLAGQTPPIGVTCDWPGTSGTMLPLTTVECTSDPGYVITAADQSAGGATNVATAAGTDPGGTEVVSRPSTATVPVTRPQPGLQIEKTAGVPMDVNRSGITDAGDTIEYSFTVTNTGNVPLDDVTVSDPTLTAQGITTTCVPVRLVPGAVARCTVSAPYVVTAADVREGAATNVATATGTPPGQGTPGDPGSTPGQPVTSPPDTTTTPTTTPQPSLSLEKTAGDPVDVNGSDLVDAGDTVVYTFTVTNTGNVPVTGVRIDDPLLEGQGLAVPCVPTSLAPGGTASCTAEPYTITVADVAAGAARNVATARGTDPDRGPVTSPEDSTTTPTTTPAPALLVEKTAGDPLDVNGSGLVDAGDTIDFTFTVTNTGNVPLRDVHVTDPSVAAVTCDDTTLDPGESTQCRASTYTVTAADVAQGSVQNTATATGTPPGVGTTPGEPVTSPPDSTSTPTTTPRPALVVQKTAGTPVDTNASGLVDAGDTITFTFTVTNTGNVPLREVVVNDRMLADAGATVTCTALPAGGLLPGDSVGCTSTPYVITPADVQAGSVANTATATATPPGVGTTPGQPVTSPPDSTSTPTTTPQPGLTVDKVASVDDVNDSGLVDAGDTIEYSFTVTNTGNVPLADVHVIDPLVGGTVSCAPSSLAVGGTATCGPRTYTVRVSDQAAGSVDNSATATGTPPGQGTPGDPGSTPGEPVTSPPDTTSTPTATPRPALDLVKEVVGVDDVNDSGITDAPDEIWYRFTVTNSGNVPVRDLEIVDPLLDGIAITCDPTSLAPGEQAVCTAEEPYVVTGADERSGAVTNTARATAVPPGIGSEPGAPVTSPPDSETVPTTTPYAGLLLDKEVARIDDVNDSGITDAPDEIWFRFTVTNSGNVPVHGIEVRDPLLGTTAVTCTPSTLRPGQSVVCEAPAPHVITAAEERAGRVDNTATAHGQDPDRDPVASPEDSVSTPVTLPQPSLQIVKTAEVEDTNGSGNTDRGDRVRYSFTVTNTGNVPVRGISVSDEMLADADVPVTCEETELAPGDSTECTSDWYTVTSADEAAGSIHNVATAQGADPDGDLVTSPPGDTTVPTTPAQPALRLDKVAGEPADTNGNGRVDAGDTIRFTFELTNTGNVPLHDLAVQDPLLAGAGITVDCPGTTMAAGASMLCTASEPYVITQAEVDAGQVENRATASGQDPWDDPVTPPSDETSTPTSTDAALVIDKQAGAPVDANRNGRTDAGDTITFRFTVTNTGAVTVHDVAVVDPLLVGLDITCTSTTLAPGESTTCVAQPYRISQADVDAGTVANTAHATGSTTSGDDSTGVQSPPDSTSTELERDPGLTLRKRAELQDRDGDERADEGERIRYTFTVRNTGTTTLRNVRVNDPMLRRAGVEVSCRRTTLAPGASTTCSATYVVTRADVEAGEVANTATAVANSPDGVVHSDDDTAVVLSQDSNDGNNNNPNGWLPDTGGPAMAWLLAGLVMVGGGFGLLFAGRRRRNVRN